MSPPINRGRATIGTASFSFCRWQLYGSAWKLHAPSSGDHLQPRCRHSGAISACPAAAAEKAKAGQTMVRKRQMGVSENRGPSYSTLNSRILIIREPKIRYPPLFSETHKFQSWPGIWGRHSSGLRNCGTATIRGSSGHVAVSHVSVWRF